MKCPNCGAGIRGRPVEGQPGVYECEYCDSQVQLPGSRPKPAPPPPAPTPAPPIVVVRPHVKRRSGGGLLGCLMTVVILASVAGPLIGVFWGPIQAFVRNRWGLGGWEFPVTCGVNQTLVIEGQTVHMPGETLIRAEANCTVTLRNCTLSAETIVNGASNLKLEIRDSTLEAEESAVVAGANLTITLRDVKIQGRAHAVDGGHNTTLRARGSTLKGGTAAIRIASGGATLGHGSRAQGGDAGAILGMNGKLSVKDSKVSGKLQAVEAPGHGTVELGHGAALDGGEAGVRADSFLDLRMTDGKIRSPGVAIDAGNHSKINVRGGTVEGGRRGIRMGSHGTLRVSKARLGGGYEVGSHSTEQVDATAPAPASPAGADGPPTAPRPAASEGALSVTGGGNAAEVRRMLERRRLAFEQCARRKKASGRVVLAFSILTSGRVADAEVRPGTLTEPWVLDCLTHRVRMLRFPTHDGANIVVETPMDLGGK